MSIPLQKQYLDYFNLITGRCEPDQSPIAPMIYGGKNALYRYQSEFLRNQILVWGGDIEGIFFQSCTILRSHQIDLDSFVSFFHQTPLPPETEYDFFKIKLDRFKDFVLEVGALFDSETKEALLTTAEREWRSCWDAYCCFNPPQ